MREAIGSYWLTMLFIIFIVLFTGYLCLSINMNKSYKVKNEIINIIQKNNGLNDSTIKQISNYMSNVGYRTAGNCNDKDEIAYDIKGIVGKNKKGLFCVKETSVTTESGSDYTKPQFPKTSYYQIKVFFAIDLPVVRNLFTFSLKGSTKKMFYPVS